MLLSIDVAKSDEIAISDGSDCKNKIVKKSQLMLKYLNGAINYSICNTKQAFTQFK